MKIIYKILYGSDAYGTTMNDSDRDIRGILLPTISECLSLRELKEVRKEKKNESSKIIEDKVMFPIQKFFRLAIKSNPAVFEWLFVPKSCILKMTKEGKRIRDNRKLFLSQEIYYRFRGFAMSEFSSLTKLTGKTGADRKKKILKYGYNPKNAMNVIRLMEQGIELLETADITMPRPNAEYLKQIKRGKLQYKQIVEKWNELEEKMTKAFKNTKLPNKPQFEKANKLMVRIIKDEYT